MKLYRVEIVYSGLLNMISSNTFTDCKNEIPESITEHAPMKDTHKAWFSDPVEAEKYRKQAVAIVAKGTKTT